MDVRKLRLLSSGIAWPLPNGRRYLPPEGFLFRATKTSYMVNDLDLCYECKPKGVGGCRGICVLINQRRFRTLPERTGTDKDAERIEDIFTRLRFEVERQDNVPADVLSKSLEEVAQRDHSTFDSFVCVILSHGKLGDVYGSDDKPVSIDKIIDRFTKTKTLNNKPKIFFIQACQGDDTDPGAKFAGAKDAISDAVFANKLPDSWDVLLAYSAVPGYLSWRGNRTGSWFIRELCDVLENDANSTEHHHINTLMSSVARLVAYKYRSRSNAPQFNDMTQMICVVSTLTRLMYLTKI
ncbi:unnamed protein product [Calicophoron daubneyi]|uniref:Uncharacterized protein n=2 Tax=Calicophoron daubneyi TaxID=300641 RepID=A0AAV2TIU6_CALDB